MPSNEGRGYVLRRIMRRGMRHAHLLGAKDPIMHKLFPTLLGKMGEAYPELKRAEALITQTLETEEKRFKTTLDRGEKMLDEEAANVAAGEKFSGAVAFKLHDTFGFPLDLTQDALRAKEIEVDTDAFDACMAEQKTKARAAWSGAGGETNEKIWFDILDEVGATEFLGYDKDKAEGKVLAIVKDGKCVEKLQDGEEGIIITNQSPFYAESGGQVGDSGTLVSTNDASLHVSDTKKQVGALWLHIVKSQEGVLKTGDAVVMSVDTDRRDAIQSNHSVTHLLHEALRQVLGDHVAQKGSLQDADRTRFDVSQPNPITAEQLAEVEDIVNTEIRGNTEVITRVMPIDEARESGAMALFGEKYDDEVRVVTMGTEKGGRAFSIELCGGTHVKRTGDIGKFKITSEGALASGIRRLEAVTGARVEAYEQEEQQKEQAVLDRLMAENKRLRAELETLGGDASAAVENTPDDLIADNKKLQKQISAQRRQQGAETSDDEIKEIGGVKFINKVLAGFPAKDLKPMADDLKMQMGSGVVVLISTDEGKASIVVGVTADLTDKISAVDLVRVGSAALGGKGGGGRPDMAQAGGPDAGAANDAVMAIEKSLAG